MNRFYNLFLFLILSFGYFQAHGSQNPTASTSGAVGGSGDKDVKTLSELRTVTVLQQAAREVDEEEQAHAASMFTAAAPSGIAHQSRATQKMRVDFDSMDYSARPKPYVTEPKIDKDLAEQILADCPAEVREINNIFKFKGFQKGMQCIPKQLLFVGPPGTGKSKTAAALAAKHGLHVYQVRCSLISNEFHGSGDNNLRRIFETLAATGKPCIVILDEFQELVKKNEDPKNADTSVLASLWGLLDDFMDKPIIVIATFNYVKKLPIQIESRFVDAIAHFELSDLKQRKKVIEFHIAAKKTEAEFEKYDVEKLAAMTDGFGNREIGKMVAKACRIAWNAQTNKVTMNEFIQAINYLKKAPQKLQDPKTRSWLFALQKHVMRALPQLTSWAISIGVPLYINYLQSNKADEHMGKQEKMFDIQMKKQQEHFAAQMKAQSDQFNAQQLSHRQSMELQFSQATSGFNTIRGSNGKSYDSREF